MIYLITATIIYLASLFYTYSKRDRYHGDYSFDLATPFYWMLETIVYLIFLVAFLAVTK